MVETIFRDHQRFKDIVRGKIKQSLRKFMAKGELSARQGRDMVKIPLPQIELPQFRYGSGRQGGVGQGDGNPGDPVAGDPQDGKPGKGKGEAGDTPGEHERDVEVSLAELAEIMAEELQLPRIQPKGENKLKFTTDKFRGIRKVGPESLRHFKRTYREALKRQVSTGIYNPADPVIVPIREDKRFRAWKPVPEPQYNALILYVMDVSGSMGEEQKELVRAESFWIDTWLRHQYKGIESRYIIHDAQAREVDQDTFFTTRESGGTIISSAYKLAHRILDEEYPIADWNVYLFQFSDGDNWSPEDSALCVRLLRQELLPRVNLFGYGQVKSFFGSGQFIHDLRRAFSEDERVVLSEVPDRESVYDSIKAFLGRGR